MSDMRHSVITCEIKEVAPRVLRFTSSDETPDRQRDIVRAKGWILDNYLKNPVFLWAHDYSQPPVGKTVKVEVVGKKLITDVEFADADTYKFADTIYRLYKGGFLNAVSVGFQPLEWEGKSGEDDVPKWEGNVFTKQELLEHSAVPVPANPNALVHAKAAKVITAKELKELAKLMDKMADDETEKPAPTMAKEGDKKEEMANGIAETVEALTVSNNSDIIDTEPIEPNAVSQAEIADEMDYLADCLEKYGLNDDNEQKAWDLLNTISGCLPDEPEETERITGGDMPVEIKQESDEPTHDEVMDAVKEAIKEIRGDK